MFVESCRVFGVFSGNGDGEAGCGLSCQVGKYAEDVEALLSCGGEERDEPGPDPRAVVGSVPAPDFAVHDRWADCLFGSPVGGFDVGSGEEWRSPWIVEAS